MSRSRRTTGPTRAIRASRRCPSSRVPIRHRRRRPGRGRTRRSPSFVAMTPAHAALVTGAGVLAGAINAVAGAGPLVAFPALLGVGVGPLTANITCSVGLIPGYAGGSVASRRELAGQRDRVVALLPFAVLGGLVGALLLLVTPPSTFRAVVPYLVLISAALLALQPALARLVATRMNEAPDVHWAARVGVVLAGVYGSYFGAGLGV